MGDGTKQHAKIFPPFPQNPQSLYHKDDFKWAYSPKIDIQYTN